MSPTIITLIVLVITNVLAAAGVPLGTEQITPWVETSITIIGGIIIWVRHLALKKQSAGYAKVNWLGGIKK